MEYNCYQPYVFQSGKYQGRSVEEIIFTDPIYIGILLSYKKDGKTASNALQEHLEILTNTIPETVAKCPVCGKRSVKYFLYLNNETISKDLICCDDVQCKERLQGNHPNDYLLPLKFSSLLVFKRKTLRKKVITLFKNVFGLRGPITPEKVYTLFFGTAPIKVPDPQYKINF